MWANWWYRIWQEVRWIWRWVSVIVSPVALCVIPHLEQESGSRFFYRVSDTSRVKKCLTFLLACFLWASSASAGPSELEERLEHKKVTGELVTVTKQAISVEYSRTAKASYEMLLPITQDTKLVKVRSLDELQPGDTVKVQYEQTYREGEDGERIVLKTVATEIALVRQAPKQALISKEEGSE